ncbi:MAG TPA: hypothetical protein VNL17_14495 [Verrucomicrobiae bacterium]|nr:hypothetical protein [Verrucomicrobiae bacterium]
MNSPSTLVDLQRKVLEQEKLRDELTYRKLEKDALYWLTHHTKTKDEQDPVNPYKPFPDKPYFKPIIEVLENESPVFLRKSRTMMISWLVSGWAAHKGFTKPATRVIFQSEDEDRAINDIEYVKQLWKNSDPWIRDRWPARKNVDLQPRDSFELANDSSFIALVGNPSKIRSFHPTIYVLDEAAHVEQGEESWNVAMATEALHMIGLSSVAPGWFQDVIEFATPVDWPKYAL